MAGKSYIDCWPIYARHVVCVKFPFGTLPPRRMLLLVAQWQDPFSLQLQLQPRLHFIIFSRAHTPEHTSAHSTHTLLLLRPLSPAIPRHTHSLLPFCASIGCALVLVASAGHAQRELPAEGVACLCVCAQRYMRRGLAAVRISPGCARMEIQACPFCLLHSAPSRIGFLCSAAAEVAASAAAAAKQLFRLVFIEIMKQSCGGKLRERSGSDVGEV